MKLLVIMVLSLFSFSCEKEQTIEKNKAERPAKSKVRAARTADAHLDEEGAMPEGLARLISRLEEGEPALGAFESAWKGVWDGSMSDELEGDDEVLYGLRLSDEIVNFQQQESDSVLEVLRSGRNIGDFDPSKAVTMVSIFGGLALDQDTAKSMPALLSLTANRLPPSKGDLLLYKIAHDIAAITEPVGPFSDEEAKQWEALAQARNPTYRMIALKMFGRLCSEREREQSFLKKYLGETDFVVGSALIEETRRMPSEMRQEILRAFKAEQEKIGNEVIVEFVNSALKED